MQKISNQLLSQLRTTFVGQTVRITSSTCQPKTAICTAIKRGKSRTTLDFILADGDIYGMDVPTLDGNKCTGSYLYNQSRTVQIVQAKNQETSR